MTNSAPSIDSVPVKIHAQNSGPANGITWYQNGQKFTVPLQGGILASVIALVFKVWMTFNAMQVDVEHAKSSLQSIAQSMERAERDSKAALDGTHENKRLIESNSKLDGERELSQQSQKLEVDQRIKILETCFIKPKSCEL